MSTDYGASRYDTISEDIIDKVCPVEFTAFSNCLAIAAAHAAECSSEGVFEAFAAQQLWNGSHSAEDYGVEAADENEDYVDMKRVERAYKRLQQAFEKKTKLELHCGYVGEGLRGSDLCEEAFWYISNAMVINPALAKLERKLKFEHQKQWFMDCG